MSALQARGINALFDIQAKTFARIRDWQDVIGKARTGQGKTLAFALPMVEMLQEMGTASLKPGRPPAAVVLAPTRELAQQVGHEI